MGKYGAEVQGFMFSKIKRNILHFLKYKPLNLSIETPLKINKSFQSVSRITYIMLSKILRNQKQENKLGDGVNSYTRSQSLLYNKRMQRIQKRRVSQLAKSSSFVISPFGLIPFLFGYPSRRPLRIRPSEKRSRHPMRFYNSRYR